MNANKEITEECTRMVYGDIQVSKNLQKQRLSIMKIMQT